MRKSMLRILASMLLMFMMFHASPIIANAEKDSLDEIQKERDEVKKDVSSTEEEIEEIVDEVEDLNNEIADIEKIIKNNEEALKDVEEEMDEVEKEINAIQKRIDQRMEILKERAQSYQKQDGNVFLEIIFGMEDLSFNEIISRISLINKIAKADTDLIEEQEEDKKLIEEQMDLLEELEDELLQKEEASKEEKKALEASKKELKDKESALNDKVEDLKSKDESLLEKEDKILLERAEAAAKAAREAQEKEAAKAAKTAEASTQTSSNEQSSDSSTKGNNDDGSGLFAWPTDGGYISSGMGTRWGTAHNGVDFARTDHSVTPPIYAVESGVVETAGFNSGGYGNQVIIDHGNGMKTRYAHMSSLNVSAGQSVSRGEQIGIMGQTGDSTGVHLHLEVTKNGALQNPMNYLP